MLRASIPRRPVIIPRIDWSTCWASMPAEQGDPPVGRSWIGSEVGTTPVARTIDGGC